MGKLYEGLGIRLSLNVHKDWFNTALLHKKVAHLGDFIMKFHANYLVSSANLAVSFLPNKFLATILPSLSNNRLEGMALI